MWIDCFLDTIPWHSVAFGICKEMESMKPTMFTKG